MSLTILAYFGPETTLPVVSVLATVIGLGLTLARVSRTWITGLFRGENPSVVEEPE